MRIFRAHRVGIPVSLPTERRRALYFAALQIGIQRQAAPRQCPIGRGRCRKPRRATGGMTSDHGGIRLVDHVGGVCAHIGRDAKLGGQLIGKLG